MAFNAVNWHALFAFDLPILEMMVRATAMYLALLAVIRIIGRRSVGEFSMRDFIFILLIAAGAESSLQGGHSSVASGLVLVGTIAAWNYGLEVLSFKIPAIERLISPRPIQIIQDGRLLRRNMRREYLTMDELMTHLREEGCEEVSDVKHAFIEGDGHISVIPRRGA